MNQRSLDKIGMIVSIGCMIHCVLLPVVLPLLPLLGFMIGHSGYFHLILGGVIVLIAIAALIPGTLRHRKMLPLALGYFGIMFILAGGIAELNEAFNELRVTLITIAGSCFMVAAHYTNHKYLCSCSHHKEHKCC